MSSIKRAAARALSLILAWAQVAPALAGAATAANPSPASVGGTVGYESCQTTDEATFRAAVEAVTVKALRDGLSSVDYRAAVRDEWVKLDIGRTIDGEVDKAIAAVRDETSWGALLQSLGSEDKARELTVAVAERVYRSDSMKMAIENLATGVGKGLGGRIEIAASDAAAPAMACLDAFLGPRYGPTVAGVVTGQAGNEFKIDANAAGGDVTAGSVLSQSSDGITGAAILIMRRQLANMAGRIGQRLVGSILSRLVSVVAGGIGLVLIAKDVWDLRHGVLPIIATEMKSADSKDKVQEELARTLSDEIGTHMNEIGAEAAERIVAVWRSYRAAHLKVLDLAERNTDFRDFLGKVDAKVLPRVDETTGLILASEGEAGVLRRLQDGTLDESVNRLPEAAMEIARQTRSLETALGWNAVAGDKIGKVVEYDIFTRAKPQDFSARTLARVIELSDPLAVRRITAVPQAARDVLFELNPATLSGAARGLDETELTALAGYMTGLAEGPRARMLDLVAKAPASLKALTAPRVRDAVLASRDQAAALEMLLRIPEDDTPSAIARDLQTAADGNIHPMLIWEKHPFVVGLLALAILLMALLVRRLFRRPHPPAPPVGTTAV